MLNPVSVFLFSSLSTVALIVMQPGPRMDHDIPVAPATEASRNYASFLRPLVQKEKLQVPDEVISEIKQAAVPQEVNQTATAPFVDPEPQAASFETIEASLPAHSAPEMPSFQRDEQTVQQAPETAPLPSFLTAAVPKPESSVNPVSSELRDMSWSALGTLQQLGQTSTAPGSQGSLINSIVRRSMAHVDAPKGALPQAKAVFDVASVPQTQAPKPKFAAPAPAKPIFAGQPKTYTVVSGDNLALIAIKLYGSALKTDQLLAENPKLRANPGSLRIGQVISYTGQ